MLHSVMKVTILFGSKSDTDIMKKAAAVLKEFGVDYSSYVISAHRASELLAETVAKEEAEGTEVFIAGAGLAAALPGVVASMTTVPVIGVPLDGGKVGGPRLSPFNSPNAKANPRRPPSGSTMRRTRATSPAKYSLSNIRNSRKN